MLTDRDEGDIYVPKSVAEVTETGDQAEREKWRKTWIVVKVHIVAYIISEDVVL